MFIYKITNLINGKCYIGQTTRSVEERVKGSFSYKGCTFLKKAFDKYGFDNFKIETLEECGSVEELNFLEQYYIKHFDSTNKKIGYNICTGGQSGPMVGRKHTKCTKIKISNFRKGSKASLKTKQALSISKQGIKNPMYGKTGSTHHNSKKIICVELNKIFGSIWEASRQLNLFAQNIHKVLNGKRNSCGGFTFKYIEDTNGKHNI